MDILKNKQYKNYDYLSRYASFPYYYNTKDEKYMYGKLKKLLNNTNYVLHYIEQRDTLDYLSNKYYGRPDLYWVIGLYNGIRDSLTPLFPKYKSIKIPSLADINWENR